MRSKNIHKKLISVFKASGSPIRRKLSSSSGIYFIELFYVIETEEDTSHVKPWSSLVDTPVSIKSPEQEEQEPEEQEQKSNLQAVQNNMQITQTSNKQYTYSTHNQLRRQRSFSQHSFQTSVDNNNNTTTAEKSSSEPLYYTHKSLETSRNDSNKLSLLHDL